MPPSPDWELRIAVDQWLLFNEGELIDDGAITIDGDQVSIESHEVPGESVLRFKVDETALRLSFVSQNRPEISPAYRGSDHPDALHHRPLDPGLVAGQLSGDLTPSADQEMRIPTSRCALLHVSTAGRLTV